jgi:hypothetical protein
MADAGHTDRPEDTSEINEQESLDGMEDGAGKNGKKGDMAQTTGTRTDISDFDRRMISPGENRAQKGW